MDARRFEAQVNGHLAKLDYQIHGGVFQIDYVMVPSEIGGRGIGSALVKAALEWAKTERLKPNPICGFARAYMDHHPELKD